MRIVNITKKIEGYYIEYGINTVESKIFRTKEELLNFIAEIMN